MRFEPFVWYYTLFGLFAESRVSWHFGSWRGQGVVPKSRRGMGDRGPAAPGGAGLAWGLPLLPMDKAGIKWRYYEGMAQTSPKARSEWDALYERARLILDDDGVAQEEKRKEVAAKKLNRAGLKEPPVDLDLVKRTLVEYARTKRYHLALESTGVGKDEMNIAYDLWPESKTVYEYVQRMRDKVRSQEMEEVVDIATDKMRVLLKDDKGKCLVNAKLVMQTLERLDRKRFGEEQGVVGGARNGGEGREPLVYQISNVQLNLVGTDAIRKVLPSGGTVDVDAVVRALEEEPQDGK